MSRQKILVVDDHAVVVEGIKSLLADKREYEVAGAAANGREAVKQAEALKPDIVIMDISMPELKGCEAAIQIRQISPDIRVIVYSMHSDTEYVLKLFKANISAYVLKDSPVSDLLMAIESVKCGGTYYSAEVSAIISRHLEKMDEDYEAKNLIDCLSIREMEIFRLLADGETVKNIGEILYISSKTVETHKYNIMKKLKVNTVTDLTKIAIKHNLIEI